MVKLMKKKFNDVYYAKKCPYCGSGTKNLSETDIYGREYSGRKVIACKEYPKCNSYVGCHDNGKPLGRLANIELRQAKKKAHEYFDLLYKENHMNRLEAYKRLSIYLDIPKKYTHIGMFNITTCKKVIEFSKTELNIKL